MLLQIWNLNMEDDSFIKQGQSFDSGRYEDPLIIYLYDI